jgi:Protein of unknown function (DUF3606)
MDNAGSVSAFVSHGVHGHQGIPKWQTTEPGAAQQIEPAIDIDEPYQVEYWTKELGITAQQLRQLIAKHGVMVADIRRALGRCAR